MISPTAIRFAALLLVAGSTSTASAQAILTDDEVLAATRHSFPEYCQLLAMPADAASKEDILRNAAWLEKAFASRGFTTRQLENDGRPLVFAQLGKEKPGRKTILFYMHFDSQPADAAQWSTDPYTPTLRRRDGDGAWQSVAGGLPATGPLDPEWRVFARAAADDKGPIAMFLAAIDALKRRNLEPAVNVKVLLDSEEEKGSPSLHMVMAAHREALRSDGIIVYDGGRAATERPAINFGNRGSIQLNLTVFGARTELHSGLFGNVAPNAGLQLAGLVASMKDESGKVIVPRFYDGIAISDADRKVMARQAPASGVLEKRIGTARLQNVAGNAVESVQYPSLDVLWLGAGAVGTTGVNSIPATATASFNVRTVPETPPARVYALLQDHIVANGYHLVEGKEPTDVERGTHARLAKLTMTAYPSTQFGFREPMDTAFSLWAIAGVSLAGKVQPDLYRMGGSTLPMGGAVSVLMTPYLVVPLINADSAQHAANENLRLGNYMEGIRGIAAMLTTTWNGKEGK